MENNWRGRQQMGNGYDRRSAAVCINCRFVRGATSSREMGNSSLRSLRLLLFVADFACLAGQPLGGPRPHKSTREDRGSLKLKRKSNCRPVQGNVVRLGHCWPAFYTLTCFCSAAENFCRPTAALPRAFVPAPRPRPGLPSVHRFTFILRIYFCVMFLDAFRLMHSSLRSTLRRVRETERGR